MVLVTSNSIYLSPFVKKKQKYTCPPTKAIRGKTTLRVNILNDWHLGSTNSFSLIINQCPLLSDIVHDIYVCAIFETGIEACVCARMLGSRASESNTILRY